MNSNRDSLLQIAGIFQIISCVVIGWTIIPLAWLIPMTIATFNARKDHREHVALGVCSIFFSNLIAGILILIAGGEKDQFVHKPMH
jgi:predicted permease